MTELILDDIIKSQPREPFPRHGKSRRPPNYRDHAEYRRWQADIKAWEQDSIATLRNLYTVVADSESIALSSANEDQPRQIFMVQADGTIHGPSSRHANGDAPSTGWLCPLELPAPRQDLLRWADTNRRRRNPDLRWPATIPTSHPAQSIIDQANNHVNATLAAALRPRLDNQAIKALRRIYRPTGTGSPGSLIEYNIAVRSLDALQELHRNGNSGAAGWLIGCLLQLSYRRPKAQMDILPTALFSLPHTPGQAITLARRSFRAVGGDRHWKTLVRTPAKMSHGYWINNGPMTQPGSSAS